MTFQNINYSRVVRAVVISFIVSFFGSCLMLPLIPQGIQDRSSDIVDLITDPDMTTEQRNDDLRAEMQSLMDDFGPDLNLQYGLQWSLATLILFGAARWAAKGATSSRQAAGYGMAVGIAFTFSYGVFCVICSLAYFIVQLVFLGLFLLAGYLGGRYAGQRLPSASSMGAGDLPAYGPTAGTYFDAQPKRADPAPGGPGAETFYNMGVMAALGGRRDEARQHFSRVLQMQPRHLAAWLQMANLADNPEQAWNYVQQARMISPNDPAVVQAVAVIWPQVAANAARSGPSTIQPPYAGGETNGTQIPRSTLPGAPTNEDDPPKQP